MLALVLDPRSHQKKKGAAEKPLDPGQWTVEPSVLVTIIRASKTDEE